MNTDDTNAYHFSSRSMIFNDRGYPNYMKSMMTEVNLIPEVNIVNMAYAKLPSKSMQIS